jgi:predicted TIM-barrel fold metal-dependent hydrolase
MRLGLTHKEFSFLRIDNCQQITFHAPYCVVHYGRQPYSARRFLIKYQDRLMFGTDTSCKREAYRTYFRFLETDDEYFDSAPSHHLQGFWMIYGVFLPKDVLEKIYYKNAQRLLYFGDELLISV